MFFVDEDDARMLEGHEHGRARPDDDRGSAFPGHQPGAESFAVVQTRVEYRYRKVEAAPEPFHHLRGEPDLRDQQQGLAPVGHHLLNGLQVDFGLAAASNAFQHRAMELPQAVGDSVDGPLLRRAQCQR